MAERRDPAALLRLDLQQTWQFDQGTRQPCSVPGQQASIHGNHPALTNGGSSLEKRPQAGLVLGRERIGLARQEDELRLRLAYFLDRHAWIANIARTRVVRSREPKVGLQRITAVPIGEYVSAPGDAQDIVGVRVAVERHPPGSGGARFGGP